jgi:hypothetical protein
MTMTSLWVEITRNTCIFSPAGRGGARCSSRAAKVALMKMKLHAVGEASTPQVNQAKKQVIFRTWRGRS